MEFYTTVDDELYDELCELVGQKIVYFEIWEDELADELQNPDDETEVAAEVSFDIDLYLEDGIYFQLYSTALFPRLDAEPWTGQETVRKELGEIVRKGLTIGEIAVDEEDGLILVMSQQDQPVLYGSVGGWLIEEWDELPDDSPTLNS